MAVEGPLMTGDAYLMIDAALTSRRLGCLVKPSLVERLASGRLRTCPDNSADFDQGFTSTLQLALEVHRTYSAH